MQNFRPYRKGTLERAMTDSQEDKPEEVEARMAAALKRALSTPPKPHKAPAAEFVALDGALYVARIFERQGRSITADLYRNMDEFRQGKVMERQVKLLA